MRTTSPGAFAKFLFLGALLVLAQACSSPPGSEDVSTSADQEALSANEKSAYDFFVAKGLTKDQAAGVVGNLIQESSVSPTSVQFGGGPGRGIAQWSVGGRWNHDHDDNVEWYASLHKMSMTSLTLQLDFVWYELTTFSGYGLSRLRASTSISSATVAFQNDFEGCGTCDESNRIKYAEEVLAAFGGGGGGGGGGGAASCYSDTLGRTVPMNACVQSDSDEHWYQCDNGNWADRWTDPANCSATYPLHETGKECYSSTKGKDMPDNACVQSESNREWYQCANGSWADRWTDPDACNGIYPL